MILTDEVIARYHRISKAVLGMTAQGVFRVRSEVAEAEIGTGYALFAGNGSPLTQVTGFAHLAKGEIGEIEAFFKGRCENWEVGVTPFTDPETFRALLDAGYRPGQFEGHLAQWVGDVEVDSSIEIVELGVDVEAWKEVAGRGWLEDEGEAFVPSELEEAVSLMPGRRYLAYIDGQPAAAASMYETDDGVYLGGASTRVPFRGHGLQSALLKRRLMDAGKGRFALMGAVPGTTSYRNAQRAAFTPLFSSVTLMRR